MKSHYNAFQKHQNLLVEINKYTEDKFKFKIGCESIKKWRIHVVSAGTDSSLQALLNDHLAKDLLKRLEDSIKLLGFNEPITYVYRYNLNTESKSEPPKPSEAFKGVKAGFLKPKPKR